MQFKTGVGKLKNRRVTNALPAWLALFVFTRHDVRRCGSETARAPAFNGQRILPLVPTQNTSTSKNTMRGTAVGAVLLKLPPTAGPTLCSGCGGNKALKTLFSSPHWVAQRPEDHRVSSLGKQLLMTPRFYSLAAYDFFFSSSFYKTAVFRSVRPDKVRLLLSQVPGKVAQDHFCSMISWFE